MPEIQAQYSMNVDVLSKLLENKDMYMGQIGTAVQEYMGKKRQRVPMCSTRNRGERLVSSLMYGPKPFVATFLEMVPVLRLLKLNREIGACDVNDVVSMLEENYMWTHPDLSEDGFIWRGVCNHMGKWIWQCVVDRLDSYSVLVFLDDISRMLYGRPHYYIQYSMLTCNDATWYSSVVYPTNYWCKSNSSTVNEKWPI